MLALLAAALLAQQSVAPTDTGARLSGRVVSIYPAAVGGVTVDLMRIDGPRGSRMTTTTDSDGRFAFTRLPQGRYELTASKAGYASRSLSSERVGFERGVSLTVKRGQSIVTADVPIYRMATLAGRVIRSNGAAAPGIQVVLAQRRGNDLVPLTETQTTTAWDGRYAIASLPPGSYLVLAAGVAAPPARLSSTEQAAFEINGTRADDFTRTLYPGVPVTEPGARVTVVEGIDADGIDIWLVPARRFSVSGRISWPSGASVRDITIEYGAPSDPRTSIWTVSDPGGVFTVDGVAPGSVVLMVTADSDRGPLMGLASTDVRTGNVEDLAIALVAPGSVEGRVMLAPDIPASARPVRIALVPKLLNVSRLYPAPGASLDTDGRFHLTSALGQYEVTIPGLPPGYRVAVSHRGRALPGNRIGIGAAEIVTDLLVTISK